MDGCGVVRDEPLEVRVYLEVIWNVSVLLPVYLLCLIELHRREENTSGERPTHVCTLGMARLTDTYRCTDMRVHAASASVKYGGCIHDKMTRGQRE